jgi:hypothetical protein
MLLALPPLRTVARQSSERAQFSQDFCQKIVAAHENHPPRIDGTKRPRRGPVGLILRKAARIYLSRRSVSISSRRLAIVWISFWALTLT